MGAFDSIEASAACPQCGDLYYLEGNQTKFFEPDYHEQRWMKPGEVHPLEAMPDREHSAWSRIRDPIGGERFTLLLDFDDLFRCACGCPCAPLLHFVHTPGTIMLERAELLDMREPVASRVDFADNIVPWPGSWDAYQPAMRAFDRLPAAERAAVLHERFASWVAYESDDTGPWPVLVGPTRCEACGDTRERVHDTTGGPFFGHNEPILIGARIPFDEAQPGRRVRRRALGDTVTVLGLRGYFGCHCGAGRARYVARFDREPGALVLVDLALRASDDVTDIDYEEK